MILLFVDQVTPRWKYTFEFIFGLRGIDFELTDDNKIFENAPETKFQLPSIFGKLLNGNEIHSELQEKDILSRLFFVLSRMEEYQPKELDSMERFSAKSSWQFQNECLEQCVCDRWAHEFIDMIEKLTGSSLNRKKSATEIIPTFDIDNAFAFQFKEGKRRLLSNVKDIVTGDFNRFKERKNVLSGKEKDPYDSYSKIEKIAEDFSTRMFWLVGDYGNKDFNISIETEGIQQLIKRFQAKVQIGIHPSYLSNSHMDLLSKEISRLQQFTENKVEISRQHFLKLRFPSTYQNLLKNGIQEDYSMGFADAVGFRNGTAHPFPWFDLSKNAKTDLMIYPFACMDGTLHEYLHLTITAAKQKIDQLYQEVEQMGGQFSFIWHNETISDYGKWKGWSEVLDYTLTLKQ